MSLKLYMITSALEGYMDYTAKVNKNARDVFLFFTMDRGNEEQIQRRQLEFVAGEGYNLENIVKTDFIYCPIALLFSEKFVEKVGDVLKEELQFFPCKLICKEKSLDWYIAKIIRRIPMIDREASTYTTLTDGEKVLEFPKYRRDVEEKFFIARDTENIAYYVVSEQFKNLCTENELLIGYDDPEFSLCIKQ